MTDIDVVVIGSGLAGMSAAVFLSEAGKKVTVLEANPFIGGRTSSWLEMDMPVESGLHRFLGFYTALPDILKQVGIDLDEMLTWEDEVEIRTTEGIHATFGASPLHKPFKTLWNALGHNNFVSVGDKVSLGHMFAMGMQMYIDDPRKLDGITVTDFARQHDVSDEALRRVLVPATEGIFFVPPERYSMYNLMGLFMPYLKSSPKLRVGAFNGGMSKVMMQPMADYVQARGGKIRTDAKVSKLLVEKSIVTGVIAEDKEIRADRVILAASLQGAKSILRNSGLTGQEAFADLIELPTMPAVTFQIDLNKPAMEIDRTTFGPGTVLASFAEQSRTTFQGRAGRLSVILANPENFLSVPPADILDLVVRDAGKLGIDLKGKVTDYRKIAWPHDFYSLETNHDYLRPPQETPIPGLTLAGDYTRQPYLATMEGAVVSGKLASEIVLGVSKG